MRTGKTDSTTIYYLACGNTSRRWQTIRANTIQCDTCGGHCFVINKVDTDSRVQAA